MTEQLRGHHLMCALGFRGLGYSPEFARNMAAILARLDASPATGVTVTDAPDPICAGFPADQPDHCALSHIAARDRRVIAAIGLRPGDTRSWGALRARLGRAFVPGDLDALCASCPWLPLGHCAHGLAWLKARDTANLALPAGPHTRP